MHNLVTAIVSKVTATVSGVLFVEEMTAQEFRLLCPKNAVRGVGLSTEEFSSFEECPIQLEPGQMWQEKAASRKPWFIYAENVGGTRTVWNPDDAYVDGYTISEDGKTLITSTPGEFTGWASIRASGSQSSGKKYYEMFMDNVSGDYSPGFAIALATAPLDNWIGSDEKGYGISANGGTYHASGVGTKVGDMDGPFVDGDTMAFAVDFELGMIHIYKNNIWQFRWEGLTLDQPLFPASYFYYAEINASGTLRTTSVDCIYSPPEGFEHWDILPTADCNLMVIA